MRTNAVIKQSFFVGMVACFVVACQKKDMVALSSATDMVSYTVEGQNPEVNLSEINHFINLRFPSTLTDASSLAATFSVSPGATAAISNIAQTSGVTTNNFQSDLVYDITAADHNTKQQWTVRSTNNDYSYNWGMGRFVKSVRSNDRNYDWYIDQGTTGTYASVNCGPASVTMACKWSDASFSKTTEYARQQYKSSGGWWFTYDVDAYLTDNAVPHAIFPMTSTAESNRQFWTSRLDSGNIIILCIDMNYVNKTADQTYHVDKFYDTYPGWGHFFVIKGYQQADDQFYFDIYDPFSEGDLNADGGLKGKDRFYRFQDVFAASSNWWNYCFVVAARGSSIQTSSAQRPVKVSEIRHAHGW